MASLGEVLYLLCSDLILDLLLELLNSIFIGETGGFMVNIE